MADPWAAFEEVAPAPVVRGGPLPTAPQADPWAAFEEVKPAPAQAQAPAVEPDPHDLALGGEPSAPAAPRRSGQAEPVSTPQAIARGAERGASFGFADEMKGVEAASGLPAAGSANPTTMVAQKVARTLLGGARLALGDEAAGQRYEQARDQNRQEFRDAHEQHPWATTGGQVGGAGAGLIVGGTTAAGAKLLGLVGSLPTRIAAGAASGAALGAVTGFGEGEGGVENRRDEAIRGAEFGAALGAAAPVVGRAIGAGVGKAAELIGLRAARPEGLGSAAAGVLREDMQAAGGVPAVRQALAEAGPDALLLDASQSLQGRAQGLAVRPETRQTVLDPLVARNEGTNARLRAVADDSLGPAPIPSQAERGIAANRSALGPAYEEALAGAQRVDTSALARRLETAAVDARGAAHSAAREVRAMLDVPGNAGTLDPSPRALLSTRQAIDGRLASETDGNVRRILSAARQEVDDELARAVPNIKNVDAQFAELARQSRGLERGSELLDGGKGAVRPQELADELVAAAQPQGTMVGPSATPMRMREGVRAEIDRLMGTQANDLQALRQALKSDGDWNQEKLIRLFGRTGALRVIHAVDQEAAFRETFNRVYGNAQSEFRRQAAEAVKVRERGVPAGDATPALAGLVAGPKGAAVAYGVKGAKAVGNEVLRRQELARNRELASVLVMRDSPERDRLLADLGRQIGVREASALAGERVGDLTQLYLEAQGNQAREALPYSPLAPLGLLYAK